MSLNLSIYILSSKIKQVPVSLKPACIKFKELVKQMSGSELGFRPKCSKLLHANQLCANSVCHDNN